MPRYSLIMKTPTYHALLTHIIENPGLSMGKLLNNIVDAWVVTNLEVLIPLICKYCDSYNPKRGKCERLNRGNQAKSVNIDETCEFHSGKTES